MGFDTIGKMILTFGLIMVFVGGGLLLIGRLGLGKLPGDIFFQKGKHYLLFPAGHISNSKPGAYDYSQPHISQIKGTLPPKNPSLYRIV